MRKPPGYAGDPRLYFQASLICLLGMCGVLAVASIDAMDGEVRMRRSGLVRLVDDPSRFRGTLIGKYGLYGMGALIACVASAAGGMAVHGANKASGID